MYVHIFILRICARRRRCLHGFRWYPYFVYSSGAVSGIRGKQMTPAVASERSIFSENPPYIYIYIRDLRPSGVQFGPAKDPIKRATRKPRTGRKDSKVNNIALNTATLVLRFS